MRSNRQKLTSDLSFSKTIHGLWRLLSWEMSDADLLNFIESALEMGVTTFDHADIYGGHRCEAKFGDALALRPSLRDQMEIVTKCGIKLAIDAFPERKVKTYDYSYDYIVGQAEQSLKNLRTDRIDVLLLHRASPLMDPQEIAKAFHDLQKAGKVRYFGVSNFSPAQYTMLQKHVDSPLVTNQVEISPYCLDSFRNGNIDFFMQETIHPMAWSPVAGGKLFSPTDDKGQRLHQTLSEIAAEMELESIDKVIYAWLFKHPAGIMPVVGSGKIERLAVCVESESLEMTLEQWFRIFYASFGRELP